MGRKYSVWEPRSGSAPGSFEDIVKIVKANRSFADIGALTYGDHGLESAIDTLTRAIQARKRIALYADYDVDGTMSCVSWIWFLEAIGYDNFIHYIPCRFKEGYGLNLKAIEHLIDNEGAQLVITMDTGITANAEAAFCRERGVEFICTDHHKIQPEKMPDCVILNPKMHPDELYQELCGCGITFVLLRRLAENFSVPTSLWGDLLALAGMATICDVVPLNGVNHKLARLGVNALLKSNRPILKRLREACSLMEALDEKDVGFRLGPRINAVGRLEHADKVIKAFTENDPEPLIHYMSECNELRKSIQKKIVAEAMAQAEAQGDAPILFLGGDWHPGVVGIAASKIAETFWRPTWLFQRGEPFCKGSARSIPGFDVTDAMAAASAHFEKFGGHRAAGGFSFKPENEALVREAMIAHATRLREQHPEMWQSRVQFDCALPVELAHLTLCDTLDEMKPFGHGFEEPLFAIEAPVTDIRFYNDKTTGEKRHTAVFLRGATSRPLKVMFFNEVLGDLKAGARARFLVRAQANTFRGETSLSLMGDDWDLSP